MQNFLKNDYLTFRQRQMFNHVYLSDTRMCCRLHYRTLNLKTFQVTIVEGH